MRTTRNKPTGPLPARQDHRKKTVTRTERDGDLADLLFRCRAEKNLAQHEVGAAVGLSQKAVGNIEQRLSKPRRTTRARIEEFLRQQGYLPPKAA